MEWMSMDEIREKFLSFFESKGHLRLKSFPLIPHNDKSLLLINSGMAPLKPYFTGKEVPPRKRVTTCQKCIRTPDIERVGKTARHATFFEMLGNFSFGDYFKESAIPWAWEFATQWLKLPEDKLWVTIYQNDDEAFEIWNKVVGVPDERIIRMGKEDNFWEIGLGPCGPCSELYFDRGVEKGCGKPDCAPGCDCDRFMEFWNLVFTQFDKDEAGNYNRLANPNIDTGMGLERMAAIMQGVDNIFEVDVVKRIMDDVLKMSGTKYNEDRKRDVSIRVITDHIRGITFMIGDGILPSNEGRGYVLRRILRRAARHGKLLGLNEPFLYKLVDSVAGTYISAYPELTDRLDYIKEVVKLEEERFNETIDQGISKLQVYIDGLKAEGKAVLSGEDAFKLYDTYGFPLDLTKEILEEQGIEVDEEGFNREMSIQKERARANKIEDNSLWANDALMEELRAYSTEFVGYERLESKSKVLAILKDRELVSSASEGEEVGIILDTTPFYAESGGQVGDKGTIYNNNVNIIVFDCKKVLNKHIHIGKIRRGIISVGDVVNAEVDKGIRMNTARNHTATHLLHKALREILGEHVHQAGSLVTPEYLRFDFSHYQGLSQEQLDEIERRVNEKIYESLPVEISVTTLEEAQKIGAMALFTEKYGDRVRIVKAGDYSMELCGGTHLKNTSEIGVFKIVSEGAVGAGLRRIEARTGPGAYEYLSGYKKLVSSIADYLKINENDLENRVIEMLSLIKDKDREIETLKQKIMNMSVDEYLKGTIDVKGVRLLTLKLNSYTNKDLRDLNDLLKSKLKSGVLLLAGVEDGKVNLVASVTQDIIEKGLKAGEIIKEVSAILNGSGGGRPDMAQGGGKDSSRLDEAFLACRRYIEDKMQ
ncbi:alanine--tRNA ligase [Calorimonas adulescens]|uniref:Alanine--tRNA ligase n=1 Tax=Calorimonas adulescens TaxID=2606906 RepID=A0A5D8QGY1_9THEO|nr:alanine--tRNA ligase [Calorimonas adulescens]TZE83489.1 alanine--tRNA ligase [Calorimonas adulescens]